MPQTVSNTKFRRVFDTVLKLQVVQMVKKQGLSISQVCKDMKLGQGAARRWLSQFAAEQSGSSGHCHMEDRLQLDKTAQQLRAHAA